MTIERDHYNGPITFTCDGPSCDEIDETHCEFFNGAHAKMKAHGWVSRLDEGTGEWQHFCRVCK